jgi:integrase
MKGHEFEQLYTVMLATGLRIGEALGLRWADVDLPTARLRVRQQLVEVPGRPRTFSEPKSAHGRRTIPLIPAAVSALHAQRARVLENRLQAADSWQRHDRVFPDEIGGALVSRRVERVFKQALKRVGLPTSYTPHTLRHSAATCLLAAGCRIALSWRSWAIARW